MLKFRHYLLGHRFVIRTYQKSLRSITEQTVQTPEQQLWLHKLLGYEFTVEYKPGKLIGIFFQKNFASNFLCEINL